MKKQNLTVSQAAKRAKKIRYRQTVHAWSEKDTPEALARLLVFGAWSHLTDVVQGRLCANHGRYDECRVGDDRLCAFCRRVEILPDDFEPRMEAGAEMQPTVAVEFEHLNPQRPASPEQVAEMFVRGMPSACRRIAAGLGVVPRGQSDVPPTPARRAAVAQAQGAGLAGPYGPRSPAGPYGPGCHDRFPARF